MFMFWRDEQNRKAVAAIVATVTAGLGILAWFGLLPSDDDEPTSPPAIELNCNSSFTQTGDGTIVQNCGDGDVQLEGRSGGDRITCNSEFQQDGSGTLIQICGDGRVTVGLTQEKFFEELSSREAQIRADLERASVAEKALLRQELNDLRAKMDHLEASYAEAVEQLEVLRVRLLELQAVVDAPSLQAAQDALLQGDRRLADELLASVQVSAQGTIAIAAEAAFLRGEIAAQDVRWADAAEHYSEAARLKPDYIKLFKACEYAWRAGEFRKSVRFAEDLVETARQEGKPQRLSAALAALGVSMSATGDYARAEALYREAIDFERRAGGAPTRGYAHSLYDLSNLIANTGQFAEELLREALEITQKAVGPEHADIASLLNSLAFVLKETGRRDEALTLYREAAEVSRKVQGAMHPDYSVHLSSLGALLSNMGEYEEAEAYFAEAISISSDTLAPDHPDHAILTSNLAVLYFRTDRQDDAIVMQAEAIGVVEGEMGPDHPYTHWMKGTYQYMLDTR